MLGIPSVNLTWGRVPSGSIQDGVSAHTDSQTSCTAGTNLWKDCLHEVHSWNARPRCKGLHWGVHRRGMEGRPCGAHPSHHTTSRVAYFHSSRQVKFDLVEIQVWLLLITFKLSQAVDCLNLTHKLTTIQICSNLSTEFQSKNTNYTTYVLLPTFELVCRIPLGSVDFCWLVAHSGMVPCTLRYRSMSRHSPRTCPVAMTS